MTRESTIVFPDTRPGMYRTLGNAFHPVEVLTVSQWADKNRILSSKSSSEQGRWHTDRTPYLREIMDSLSVRSTVQFIVMMFATQTGKTEVSLNWIGYVMDHAPGPMLTVLPTLDVKKRWVMQRLNPMISSSEILSRLVIDKKSRDSANSLDMKDFPAGMMIMGGANSAASLSSMPICYVSADEVDDYPWDVGDQGDPMGLVIQRTANFPRRKILMVSSPKKGKGKSRIGIAYSESDQRVYHVPCPHCHELQPLNWRHPDGNLALQRSPTSGVVYYVCPHCGSGIDHHHKTRMLRDGQWIAKYPERKTRGYWLSGLYSPIGLGFDWTEILTMWETVQRDETEKKRFVNTVLAEEYEEQGESIDGDRLMTRLEDYPDELPVIIRVAWADVQKDRIEVTISDVGVEEEMWFQDHIILPGETIKDDVWDDLAAALEDFGVEAAGVDAGYNTDQVNKFLESRSWCVATKGMPGSGRPLIEDERKRKQRMRYRRKKGTASEPLGVDQGKTIIMARLNLKEPGPGYIHFRNSSAFDDEYFAQLGAEKYVTKMQGNRPVSEWVAIRPRNEALDCAVGVLAIARLSGRDLSNLPEKQTESPQSTKSTQNTTPARPHRKYSNWR